MRPRRRAERGIAYLLVMIAVAAAAVMGWAMLSVSSLRAQVDVNALDGVEADGLAESGANLAIYYLRFPDRSPIDPVVGAAGNAHYPGQASIALFPDSAGTVSVTVANPRANEFRIVSESHVPARQGGAIVTHTVVVTATLDRAAPSGPAPPGDAAITGIRVTSWMTP
jgi:hypothetical protein